MHSFLPPRLLLWCCAAVGLGALLAACADSRSAGTDSRAAPGEIRLTDVTEEAGLGAFRHDTGAFGKKYMPEIVGAGGGFLDYDGDGWEDLLLVGGGGWEGRTSRDIQALYLYRNNGDGTFTDVSDRAGLAGVRAYGFGVTAADYDNDGDQDFFLTTLGRNLLFRNDRGVFTEVGSEAGVSDHAAWSSAALFFDADRDGDLDLYVGNYVDWTPETDLYCQHKGVKGYCTPQAYEGKPSAYYVNNGDGTFANRTVEAGFYAAVDPKKDKAFGVVEIDYDRDGWPDLYVTHDTERNQLLHNNGDGTFTDRAIASGVAYDQYGAPRAGMGTDAAVVDSTGEVTFFVGNFSQEMVAVFTHTGNGLFMDRATVSRIGYPSLKTLTFGLVLLDIDHDTDVDLLLANGHVQEHIADVVEGVTFRQPTQLFLNDGDGRFEEHRPGTGVLAEPMVARGAAYADYDRDGDLDVLLTENDGPAHLWRNDLEGGRYLRVRLRGTESNRDGLGARLVAEVGGLAMERRVRTGSSFLSSLEKTASFGLGRHERVERLTVYWPSGRVERFEEVAGNREVLLVEGSGVLEELTPGKPLAAR